MSEGRRLSLVRSLYGLVKNFDEAVALIKDLANNNFEAEWSIVTSGYTRKCVRCGRPYSVKNASTTAEGFCSDCNTDRNRRELHRVTLQNRRARKLGVPATLTYLQWEDVLRHFNYKCAYCKTEPYVDMEHYVPLAQCDTTRGTTLNNVVPACKACNYLKRNKNPRSLNGRAAIKIPDSDLNRVQAYLDDQG